MKISDSHLAVRAMAGGSPAAVVTGISIDTLSWDNICFIVNFGDTVDATVEVQVSENDADWLTITDKSVAAVAGSPTIVDCGRLDRRYVRLQITPASATDIDGAVALLSCPLDSRLPPANKSTLSIFHNPAAA